MGVIIDEKMNFLEHVDVMVGKAFAMLGFIRRLSFEFRHPYTLKSHYTSLVCLKLEYASCVWSPLYDVHTHSMTRLNACRDGLYDMLCLVCHRMSIDVFFCTFTFL
jgi:hypothetical protein